MSRKSLLNPDCLVKKRIDPKYVLNGVAFGQWTVLKYAGHQIHGTKEIWYKCRCSCGAIEFVRRRQLLSGLSRSCGCTTKAIKHGEKKDGIVSYEYGVWKAMRQRALNPNHSRHKDYFDRGIGICSEWDDFTLFLAHVGRSPSRRHTIERIDNDKGYEPGNVRWATYTEQCRNKRTNRRITIDGVTLCLVEWLERLNITDGSIYNRMKKHGIPMEEAIAFYERRNQACLAS